MPTTAAGVANRRLNRERFLELAKNRGADTIEEAADLVGLSRQQLHKLFNGEHQPSGPTLSDMTEVLGCAIGDIYPRAAA